MRAEFSGRQAYGVSLRKYGRWAAALLSAVLCGSLLGCPGDTRPRVVLYSDQDRAVVEPLMRRFTQDTGVVVDVKYADAKAARDGTGLSQRLRDEQAKPGGDLYWGCDPTVAVELMQDSVVDRGSRAAMDQMAKPYVDPQSPWTGLGARARVLLMNTRLVPKARTPKSFFCLAQPDWQNRCAMADPRTNGAARYHIAVMFAALPEVEATEMLRRMKDNGVQFLPDEAAVVAAVAEGKAAWGVTNSDLAEAAVRAKKPVRYVAPDQETDSTRNALGGGHIDVPTLGTPVLEEPLLLITRRPHLADSQRLYDYLISGQTAQHLAELQPLCLPTHKALLEQPGAVRSVGALNPHKLKACVLSNESVEAVHTKVALPRTSASAPP
jgi:iron(III) transport system substrate-binding protein